MLRKWAILDSGVVVGFTNEILADSCKREVFSDDVAIGWFFNGTTFLTPQQAIQLNISDRAKKLIGVAFNNIQCSATANDQNGLVAVKMRLQNAGQGWSTMFEFENGNKLNLGAHNFSDFELVWIPFRESFFLP